MKILSTHQIFVANYITGRVEIFSETGEFLYQLGVRQLTGPCGIAIHGDSINMSFWVDHTVNKLSLTEVYRVRRIGGEGSNNGQFLYPTQVSSQLIPLVVSS